MSTENEVSIRPAVPTDATAILNLLRQLQTESDTFVVANNLDTLTSEHEASQIDLIQNTTTNIIFVAAFGDELVGIATAIERDDHSNTSELGVAVLATVQGNGLGTALVDEIIYWAETFSTIDALMLTVKNDNVPAVKIYEKFGFEDIATNNNDIRTMTYTLAPLLG